MRGRNSGSRPIDSMGRAPQWLCMKSPCPVYESVSHKRYCIRRWISEHTEHSSRGLMLAELRYETAHTALSQTRLLTCSRLKSRLLSLLLLLLLSLLLLSTKLSVWHWEKGLLEWAMFNLVLAQSEIIDRVAMGARGRDRSSGGFV